VRAEDGTQTRDPQLDKYGKTNLLLNKLKYITCIITLYLLFLAKKEFYKKWNERYFYYQATTRSKNATFIVGKVLKDLEDEFGFTYLISNHAPKTNRP